VLSCRAGPFFSFKARLFSGLQRLSSIALFFSNLLSEICYLQIGESFFPQDAGLLAPSMESKALFGIFGIFGGP
jgi:hypothetical protein